MTQRAPDGSKTVSVYQAGRLQSVTRRDAATPGAIITKTTYGYDAHGRQAATTDLRNGATTYTYNNADLVASTTTPAPGNGQAALTTATFYDTMLRPVTEVLPDGTSVSKMYDLKGLLATNSGSRTYPVAYTYDAQGRMKTMRTWQSVAAGTSALTTWNYDGQRGWLVSKDYPDPSLGGAPALSGTNGPTYTYTPGGRIKTRTWARGNPRLLTTYKYGFDDTLNDNNHPDLVGITYANDPAGTSGLTNTYDRRGRKATVLCNGTTTTLAYNDASQLISESHANGPLGTLSLTNTYDAATLRRKLVQTKRSTTLLTTNAYGYDPTGRLAAATNGGAWAAYNYLANSPLVDHIDYQQNGTNRMRRANQYDGLNRLRQATITAYTNGVGYVVSGFGYSYNEANQRTRASLADGSYWVYRYDGLGQVISGNRYWSDGTPVAGQQFNYAFDEIGNRTGTLAGGDASGAGLRPASYTANFMNQYTNRTVPGAADILGAAVAPNTVFVNGGTNGVYRRGEYFRKELAVANSAAFGSNAVTVLATNLGQSGFTTNYGVVLLPRTPESFTHDPEGNLSVDGRWTHTWDAENRLVRLASAAGAPDRKLGFAYDYQGRRISKQATNNGVCVLWEKYLWDGWNLVAVLNGTNNTLLRSFLWGLDLSGSEQGAGGVGGLLAVNAAAAGVHFASYDGNGNVSALVQASDGTVSARYEYGPFGELLRATGPMAKANPFRFSTKYQDEETDLLYYGFRSYNPSTGRWLSRDPIGERGHETLRTNRLERIRPNDWNLYGFVYNNPITHIDIDGREIGSICSVCGQYYVGTHVCTGPPPPTTAPAIDCSGYLLMGPSYCSSGGGRNQLDPYPSAAMSVCQGFASLYTGTAMQGAAACVAQCLINAEIGCQSNRSCGQRDCCRLTAHVRCYASCGFIPTQGLPPGGAQVGWGMLLPNCGCANAMITGYPNL